MFFNKNMMNFMQVNELRPPLAFKSPFSSLETQPFPGPSEGLKIRGCQYYIFGGHNLPPFVERGLTNVPKSGGAMAPPGTTGLFSV